MKPEAGQWWVAERAKAGDTAEAIAVRIEHILPNGNIVVETYPGKFFVWKDANTWHHEPRCTGWDWIVPQSQPAEEPQPVVHYDPIADQPKLVLKPQKKQIRQKTPVPDECDTAVSVTRDFSPEIGIAARAEDPDEWVIQDRVPARELDECRWIGSMTPDQWRPAGRFPDALGLYHGYTDDKFLLRLEVRCRRRDLPKVKPEQVEQAEQCAACEALAEPGTAGCKDCNEYATAICSPEQAEQWPKYYTTLDSPSSDVAFVKRVDETSYSVVYKNGRECPGFLWSAKNQSRRKQLTEAEAMSLLHKQEPQPEKTDWSYHETQKPQPQNEAASDRVIEIPIGAGKTAVLGGNDDDETAIVILRNSSTANAIGAPVTGEDASPLIQSGDVVLRILNPQGAQVVIDAIQWAQQALLKKELDAWDPPTPEVVEQPTEAVQMWDEQVAAMNGVAPPPHPAPDDSLEMLF